VIIFPLYPYVIVYTSHSIVWLYLWCFNPANPAFRLQDINRRL